jgi:hypothetical protein
MTDKLLELEKQLDNYAVGTSLKENDLLLFPKEFRQIHSYKIFGDDLLAIPAAAIIEGYIDEFEKPFRFLSGIDELQIFETEFREGISDEFIQIGCLYSVTEIVLLNKIKNTIHILHVQDFVALDQYKYKLEKGICSLEQFIECLKPQTVSCFANRKSYYPEYEIFEIRDKFVLKNNNKQTKYSDNETVWDEYYKLVDNAVDKGFEVHYAPRKVIERHR